MRVGCGDALALMKSIVFPQAQFFERQIRRRLEFGVRVRKFFSNEIFKA